MNTQTIEKPAACAPRRETCVIPAVNLRETKEAWLLEAEMPGVNKNGVEITVANNELTLTGRRSDEAPAGDAIYRESRDTGYRRVFDLDPAVDTARISAKIEQGVLTVTLPKTESVKPRKIEITE
jgi:HSP20 family protein